MNDAKCPFYLVRHLTCSPCEKSLSGGFDDKNNQIVICQNNCKTYKKVEEVLSHELVHMYDYCTAKIDFENVKHLACSEIRAAALTSCSRHSFDYKSYQSCVKIKASDSVALMKNLPKKEALEAVENVFYKCFNDTEPLGRCYPESVMKSHYESVKMHNKRS